MMAKIPQHIQDAMRFGAKNAAKFGKKELSEAEHIRIRLGQLLRDRATSKKAGMTVDDERYGLYNAEISELRARLKEIGG